MWAATSPGCRRRKVELGSAAEARDLQRFQPMRAVAAIAVLATVAVFPSAVSAQDKAGTRVPMVRAQKAVVSVIPVMTAEDTKDDVTVAARRFVDQWSG